MLLTTTAQVAELCNDILSSANLVALDTEFERRNTYYPILSLVQIATEDSRVYAVDCLAAKDISPIKQLLLAPQLIKIVHAGMQDFEIFRQLFSTSVENIFDTQVATFFNGAEQQLSYSSLVASYFNINIDKSLQYSDWLRRPLAANKLSYALTDVQYLIPLYQRLREELQHKYPWAKAESTLQNNSSAEENALEKTFKKLKPYCNTEQIACYYLLAQYRDSIAKRRNVIKKHALRDELLYEMAKKRELSPSARRALAAPDAEILHNILQNKQLIMQTIADTKAIDMLNRNIDPALFENAMELLKTIAQQAGISHNLLNNKSELRRYLNNKDSNLTTSWRKELIGDKLAKLLHGSV